MIGLCHLGSIHSSSNTRMVSLLDSRIYTAIHSILSWRSLLSTLLLTMLLVMEHWQSVTKLVLVLGTREQNGAALLSGHLDTPGAGHGPTLLPGHHLYLAPLGVDSLGLLARNLAATLSVNKLIL